MVKENKGLYFTLSEDKLEPLCDYVIQVMKENYPDLQIPFHSRWRHFRGPHGDCLTDMEQTYEGLPESVKGRRMMEVVVVSVLLDAGAGSSWHYLDPQSQKTLRRSEGLAFASWELIKQGVLCATGNQPKVDALGLQNLREEDFCRVFQVTKENPLTGVKARLHILRQLGQVVSSHSEVFGSGSPLELGALYDYFGHQGRQQGGALKASFLFQTVLEAFSSLWPSSAHWQEQQVGDVGEDEGIRGDYEVHNRIPFHKLSQWLTYSLIEPLESGGIRVLELDQLTGLPEYRNGGLFMDGGVLCLKDKSHEDLLWEVTSPLVVEWRALTVCLYRNSADALDVLAFAASVNFGRDCFHIPAKQPNPSNSSVMPSLNRA